MRWKGLVKKKHALFLAYDQGLEHGPSDFNDKNVDPKYIIDIAKNGGYTGFICQKGIAEKYNDLIKKSKVPLIVKLNGKTKLVKGDPVSKQVCSVQEAVELGAVGVGYTLYIGSEHENEMFEEFAEIEEEAHKKGLIVVTWIYPRGKGIKKDEDLMTYAARVGLELGADIIKIKYNGRYEDLVWAVENAGRAKIVIAGGVKAKEGEFLKQVEEIKKAGCLGLAIGRNVWQSKKPLEISEKLNKIFLK